MNKPDKLPMHTPNLSDKNFEALAAMFPNAVTEIIDENGAVVRAIDADVLSQEISTHVVSGREERYQFTWPDKQRSILLANAPIAATLRPCREESVDFDNTENLYIEGDNLDVLKLLRETYLNRVKMIYIDPPYNTGNDFVYEDDFTEEVEQFLQRDKKYDEQGNLLTPNLESNGRFHTDWLNMIYPRLKVARDLLKDDGFIFISIDDNEVENLKKICNEVFGSSNFIATFMWKRKKEISSDSKNVSTQGEYIICYSKSNKAQLSFEPISDSYVEKAYNDPTDEFPDGKWRPVPLTVSKGLSGGGYTYIQRVAIENLLKKNGYILEKTKVAFPRESYMLTKAKDNQYQIIGTMLLLTNREKKKFSNYFLIIYSIHQNRHL